MKHSPILKITGYLLLALVLAACGGGLSTAQLEAAVAETLAAMPTQPVEVEQVVEVTQVKEVTKVVIVDVTSTPAPASATPTVTETPEASSTAEVVAGARPAATATPTPVTESGTLSLGLNQLIRRYTDMTDLQKQEFVKTLPGKKIFWMAEVYNVTADGILILDNPYGGGRVTLKGVPIETAIHIDRGMFVEFRGMIESFGGSFGREIVVTNTEIVRYYYPPTPTPTATR